MTSTFSAIESNQPATWPFSVLVDLSSALKKLSLASRACLNPILLLESTSILVVTGVETPSASILLVVSSIVSGILAASSLYAETTIGLPSGPSLYTKTLRGFPSVPVVSR